ncbi:MAG: TerB family tellurite resistance protein [Proteobacteria bacterium]|nr:TerB family tellurite resistance protein [Pseudomonadota bacterium]
MDIKKLLGINKTTQKEDEDLGKLFAGIQGLLKGYTDADTKLITGFAGLLGKVAYADMAISDVEKDRIRSVLSNKLKLKQSHVNAIVELLGEHSVRLFSIEDFIYIRLLNSVCDKAEKMDLIRALFNVAAADESVSAEEDASIWTAAKGLRLSHRDFISVRAEFKEHLDILK